MIITLKARILNQLPQICVLGAGRHAVSLIKVFILYDLNNFFINFRDIASDWLLCLPTLSGGVYMNYFPRSLLILKPKF